MKPVKKIYIFTLLLAFLWCMGIIAAPILKSEGWTYTSENMYSFYSKVCHQNDARSFHLENEKLGVCIRCCAIYFGFLAGLITIPLSVYLKKKNFPAIGFFLIAAIPMVIDILLNFLGILRCTPLSRSLTGAIFGFSISWFVFPIFIEAYSQIISRKNNHSLDPGAFHYVGKTQ